MNLSFGIPSLDELIDVPMVGRAANPLPHDASSIAVIGPEGTGKSVLALHLASKYCFEWWQEPERAELKPLIIYASSDLRFGAAEKIWQRFGLDRPATREIPFERTHESRLRRKQNKPEGFNRELKLIPLSPSPLGDEDPDSLLDFLNLDSDSKGVGFLDLASYSAGDDWTFVNVLLGKLSERHEEARLSNAALPPYLLIIDSVAGFETFVGRLDAFGLEQTRRSRIARCLRSAGKSCHMVLVVEEENESTRWPEEYVTDIVLRLRRKSFGGSTIRTLEVEKARARTVAMGEHPFEILPGTGTSTGRWENADQPFCGNAYVQVHHAIPHRNYVVMADPGHGKPEPSGKIVRFGLPFLDAMLDPGSTEHASPTSPGEHGLRAGTTTALVGDTSTGKSGLGEHFVAEGFREYAHLYLAVRKWQRSKSDRMTPEEIDQLARMLEAPLVAPQSPHNDDRSTAESGNHFEYLEDAKSHWLGCAGRSISTSNVHLKKAYGDVLELHGEIDWAEDRAAFLREYQAIKERPNSDVERKHANKKRRLHLEIETLKYSTPSGVKIEGEDWVKALFLLPQLQSPAVLITNSDRTAQTLARRICVLLSLLLPTGSDKDWDDLSELIERQLIIRRLDMAPMTAASAFHVVHRNIIQAHKLICHLWFPPIQRLRYPISNRIRLVLDDLRVLASSSPDIASDASFLPFLTFFLEREGLTSLLIYSDAVRPDTRPDDEVTRRLQSLVPKTIMLWPVPFEGRNRTALAVIPPTDRRGSGLIRELAPVTINPTIPSSGPPWFPGGTLRLSITPRFELYSGIEHGRPIPVPLAVYLYQETGAFARYIDQENHLLGKLFVPADGNEKKVLKGADWEVLNAMRELCMLPTDIQYDHTVIFQIDSYWVLGQDGALMDQSNYLTQRFAKDAERKAYEDPFGVFSGPVLASSRPEAPRRVDYFQNERYRARLIGFEDTPPGGRKPDRVPFMWDFGFLLLRYGAWRDAANESYSDGRSKKPKKIGKLLAAWESPAASSHRVSWREFFGASSVVARKLKQSSGHEVFPFDFGCSAIETVNCLLLELWMSELWDQVNSKSKHKWPEQGAIRSCLEYLSEPDYNPNADGAGERHLNLLSLLCRGKATRSNRESFRSFQSRFSKKTPTEADFKSQLTLGAFCLYRVWLLLIEVLNPVDLFDPADPFQVKPVRDASRSAVASRHWYKTACEFSDGLRAGAGEWDLPLPAPLPGHFSTRGDWFLAAMASSRSPLLANHAIDLLSSRRANLTRLQMGLGLPVRDVLGAEGCKELRTALHCKQFTDSSSDSTATVLTQLKYGEIERLFPPQKEKGRPSWLWRGSILDYDRISRPLQKWSARMFRWSIRFQQQISPRDWEGGFPGYDELTRWGFTHVRTYGSFVEFAQLCDFLEDELRAAMRPENRV